MSDAVLGFVWSGGTAGRPGARPSGADSGGLVFLPCYFFLLSSVSERLMFGLCCQNCRMPVIIWHYLVQWELAVLSLKNSVILTIVRSQ
jgi:hypothetical protein